MSKKGITDIIAIVLLLMITISMIGFAWLWFNRLSQTTMNRTQSQLDSSATTSGQLVFIDNIAQSATAVNVTIKNIGTSTIPANSTKVYINNVQITACPGLVAELAPQATFTCNTTLYTQSNCDSILVTAPGNRDTLSC